MAANDMASQEIRVDTPTGRLFAKRWDYGVHNNHCQTPLVLMHDSLGSVELWRDFPERLARATHRPVVAYDRLGFGCSEARTGQVTLDFIREEAHASFQFVRNALALDRFVVVGHSVGGGMAVGIAAAYPDDCEAIITMSAQAFVEDRTLAGIRAAQVSFAQPAQVERLARYHGDKASWVLAAWIDRWLDPDFADWSLDADLLRVQCPSLVLHGSRDEYGSIRHPERIAERSNGQSTMYIGDWSHVPYREAPDQVLSLMAAWFEVLPTRNS
jgi:pimeloyl-ACP methyl ester carboxylesterase